jgi:hypothetical protein
MDAPAVRRRRISAGIRLAVSITMMMAGLAAPAAAQATELRGQPATAVEVTGGYAAFVDESAIGHGVIGGAFRFHLSRRLSVGPEIVYMIGPGDGRELFLTGNVTFDLANAGPGRTGRVTPFLVAGAGLMRHSDGLGGVGFSANEGAVTGGGGVRVWLSPRVYTASEFRIGWEPHIRITGTLGVALPD